MLLKNGEVYAAWEPLTKLLEREWPVKVSYLLAQMARKLRDQYEVIEQVRATLIKKHGSPVEGRRNQMAVDPSSENIQKFTEEYNDLMEQAVDVDVTGKVKLPTTVDGREVQVEPLVLMALDKFVEVG